VPELELDEGAGVVGAISTGDRVSLIIAEHGESVEIRLTSAEVDWLVTALRAEQQRVD